MDIKRLGYIYSIFAALENSTKELSILSEMLDRKQKKVIAQILLYNDKKKRYN